MTNLNVKQDPDLMAHEHITIDFETRSECNIRTSGAWVYAEHPTTEVLCMAYRIPGQERKLWVPEQFAIPEEYSPAQEYEKRIELLKKRLDKELDKDACELMEIELDELLGLTVSETSRFKWMRERTVVGDFPADLLKAIEDGVLIEAHNAEFEQAIWKHVIERKYGAVTPHFKQFRCSAAAASASALPRALGDVGKALELDVQKDEDGQRIMMQLARPRTKSESNQDTFWEPHTAPYKFFRNYSYCLEDVSSEEGVSEAVPPLSDSEQEMWFLDQQINQKGFAVDMDSITSILWCVDRLTERIDKKTKEITGGELNSVRQREAFMTYMAGQGFELPDVQKQTIEEWMEKDDLPPLIKTLIRYRSVLSKTTTKKFQSMLDRCSADGRIRGTLKYHGASTGRWSGQGVQPQNLPRGTEKDVDQVIADFKEANIDMLIEKYPNPFDAAASCIRQMIVASEGKQFYCADFSSIEARALVWLANDVRALQLFEEDKDVYIDMASAIYNVSVEEVSDDQRQVGKMAILGLGYGMGWKTFVKNSARMGAEIDDDFAKRVVNTYRDKYSAVVTLWKQLEQFAAAACLEHGKVFGFKGRVLYCHDGTYLNCKLPSGRVIRYYQARVASRETSWGKMKDSVIYMGVNGFTRKWEEQSTYGGKLAENVTQAVARDFMANSMKLIAPNFDIVLTVHDELLAEGPEYEGSIDGVPTAEVILKTFEELMSTRPDWALDCPIKAEGWVGKRYKK